MAQSGKGGAVIAGFLHGRLAAAQAIPAAQRTPELAGFIECCQLKDEVAALLAQPLPSGAGAAAEEQAWRTQQAALRLLRADMLCVAAPLDEYNGAHQWAVDHFKQLLSSKYWWQLGVPPFADWHTRIMAYGRQIAGSQLSASARLDRFLLLAAGLPPPPITQQLPMLHLLLDMVAQPEERAALEPALLEAQAALPAPLLTWNQLAGRLAEHTAHCCVFAYHQLATMGRLPGNDPVFATTARQCEQALDAALAAPGQPPVAVCALHTAAAVLKPLLHGEAAFFQPAAAGISCARAAGSDYTLALLGFGLARHAAHFSQHRPGVQPPFSPSQFVGWVGQAQAAFARCKRLLPGVWVNNLTDRRTPALAALPWLRQLVAAGDRWVGPPSEAARQALREGAAAQHKLVADPNHSTRCSVCGCSALTLKVCSKCRVKDWKEGGHREQCAGLAAARRQQQGSTAA